LIRRGKNAETYWAKPSNSVPSVRTVPRRIAIVPWSTMASSTDATASRSSGGKPVGPASSSKGRNAGRGRGPQTGEVSPRNGPRSLLQRSFDADGDRRASRQGWSTAPEPRGRAEDRRRVRGWSANFRRRTRLTYSADIEFERPKARFRDSATTSARSCSPRFFAGVGVGGRRNVSPREQALTDLVSDWYPPPGRQDPGIQTSSTRGGSWPLPPGPRAGTRRCATQLRTSRVMFTR